MTTQHTNCPFCRNIVIINIDWAIKNGRVFCETCLKSFPIIVGEEEKEPKAEALKELE